MQRTSVFVVLLLLACAALGITAAQAQSADPQTQAVQQVIQLANDEQAQAIAANDPTLMRDTATPAHYQQLVQINQDLLNNGVTSLQLTNITWGQINVNATTATATTSETWSTTMRDGSSTQSTDTNNYSLVNQNGAWLISNDQQPSASAANTAADPSTSRNWSGYSASNGTYTGVSATWTVPQPSETSAGVGATWVGIGGVTSRDLIQAGTQDVASGNGRSQYQAWIETLPQASRQVPLAVSPGDSVTVSIQEQSAGSGMWQITMSNNTTGKQYQTIVRYTSTQSSVEWVEEAPVGNGALMPLDNFNAVSFSQATAVENGQTITLAQTGAQPITMLNAAGQPLAVPSAVGADGSSFHISRTSASATPVPSAPAYPSNPGRSIRPFTQLPLF